MKSACAVVPVSDPRFHRYAIAVRRMPEVREVGATSWDALFPPRPSSGRHR
jgi:hypothetical protein